MDHGGPLLLSNILTTEELEQTPSFLQEKLKKYLDEFFDEFCKQKAAANRLHDYEQKVEDLQSQIQDYDVKLENYEKNVAELRTQLDTVSSERSHLLEVSSTHEKELAAIRIERNTITDERDSYVKVIERQNTELERLQQEIRSLQQQLKSSINAKCQAIARVDEIESKEVALEFKDRRMEQERNMLHNQIQTLSADLNRNVTELQTIRRDNTMQNMHLETRLSEKIEELKISQVQCVQYKETIDRLTQSIQELSSKILNQNEEANKMMDYYKKELEAKTKLAELYKVNCEDTDIERSELSGAISDLKRMLSEASEQYGDLETRFKATSLKYEQELEEKDKIIAAKKSEIENANDLLKEVQQETMESAISKLAPSAAVASRLIRSDMSLTELYSLYVKSTEDYEIQKRENARLNLQLKTILHELGENAPMIKKQELDYEKLVETNNILSQQRDEMLVKKADMEEVMINSHSKIGHLERENKKLKHSQTDLSRQVCYLLKEVQQLRLGFCADNRGPSHSGSFLTTDEVISKKLVTFSNIPELQENNQKLLLLVRDLSTKLEEAEKLKQEINESSFHEKIESYTKKIQNMQDTLNQQNNTVATLLSKCERYKKLYFELQKHMNKSERMDLSDFEDAEVAESSAVEEGKNEKEIHPKKSYNNPNASERRIRDLEQQLQDVKDQYKTLKEQHEYYIKEKKNNEKILNEQFDSMRTEVRELTSTNCKLMSSMEYTKEQIKLQHKNITTYKQQITTLEERNKNYENTIIKHEQTVHYLKDEIMKAQCKQSTAETEANQLRHENRIYKDNVSRLQSEKDSLHREKQNQNLLLNNLELIKTNMERSEMEGRVRIEQRLDETVRELSAQRRRFQEEEDRFRATITDFKKQAETAQQRMEEERVQAEKLRMELTTIKEELGNKTNQIDELSKKLQESLTPAKNDNPIVLANKKAREFEIKLEEARIEITSLTSDLAKSRDHAEQYYKMSQSAETEIKNLHEVYTTFVSKAENEIKELKATELNLKSKIAELEAEVQLTTIVESTHTNQPEQLKKTQEELKDALKKLGECNRNIRTLRAENNTLCVSLNAVETKYANEMVLHSADIQELTRLKAELTKIQDQIDELKMDRDLAKHSYDELKRSQEESIRLSENERNELESRITDLSALNSSLHDQIEALSAKLSMLSQSPQTGNNSVNDSTMETSSAELNRSTNIEEDVKNGEQLLQIIKYLRKEKDLTDARLDILRAENIRLQSENTMLQKKVDELNGFLNQERTKSEAVVVSASKHEEILRKIETLNAITDSNRILREERNSLTTRVKELNERISTLEDELFPLQNQNRELSLKIEEVSTETTSLRTEAIKWRQRANVLVEKSNKNPEEFKRLQMERENLAKMLTNEKEVLKQVTEELNSLKAEKLRLQSEHVALEKQSHTLSEEKKKLLEDFNTVKQSNMRMIQELMELKNKLLQKEEVLQKLTEDLESKEAQLQDSKNKEFQIRKIAKRYKDSFLELSNKTASAGAVEGNAGAAGTGTSQDTMELGTSTGPENTTNVEIEQFRSTIENLNGIIRSLQEENEKLNKEYDDLKASAEIDDRTKTLLREAKTRIVSLTEAKNTVCQELTLTKTKLQTIIQSSESHDAAMSGIKSQYEELVDENNRCKETVARLTRENESLLIRNNQLNRQLGLQQSAKPSTSSVAITDKSGISESSSLRTANVKPMSGSATVQQSATVTPWRGGETPLASIRPISVQNSRTAAILPTSQQIVTGGSSTSTSSSTTSSTSSSTPSSAGCSNTALVPPQQQVQVVESMSSSPTSSHTDYMPSTSSASVAVAAIPPMGSASAAESSQEAESIQQPQQPNESQLLVSGGQQQVVALVSPRVEGSTQNAPSPITQHPQDPNSQQPSTSGTSSSCSHIAVSSHSRHTPSSSSVTTTQAGSSGGHKRPRDVEGDSSTSTEECSLDKSSKHPKRMRTPIRAGDESILVGVTDSGVDVEYQVPTSSQRDQEDDIVVVDSEEDDGMAEADGGPADGEEMPEPEGYEDSYEQDMENQYPEIDETNVRADVDIENSDNNEVDIDECNGESQVQCTSAIDNQELLPIYSNDASASTSQAAAVAILAHSQQLDSQQQQQSQAISSGGSYESNASTLQLGTATPRKQNTSLHARQQKTTLAMMQEGVDTNVTEGNIEQDPSGSDNGGRRSDSSVQDSKFAYTDASVHSGESENKVVDSEAAHEGEVGADEDFTDYSQNKEDENSSDEGKKTALANVEDSEEADEDFPEETTAAFEGTENVDSESHHSSGATQSEIQDMQQGLVEVTSEDNEGIDGVSSEGEKQTVEEMEEEGREAEATTSPSINTRSKATRGTASARRPPRGFQRGGRPTPIIWQDSPGNSRNNPQNQRGPEQPGSPLRGYPNQRSQRARRMRRPTGGNYSNMRYS